MIFVIRDESGQIHVFRANLLGQNSKYLILVLDDTGFFKYGMDFLSSSSLVHELLSLFVGYVTISDEQINYVFGFHGCSKVKIGGIVSL